MECFYGSSSLILQFAICCKNITMLFLLLVNIMNTPDFLIEWRIFHMKHIRNFFPLHGLPWCGSSDGLMCIFTLWPNSMKDFWQESHLKFFCPSWIVFFFVDGNGHGYWFIVYFRILKYFFCWCVSSEL